MNYYGAADLASSFRTVRKNTLIIAGDIGEERYNFRPAPETRTVAQLLVHIALVPTLQTQIHSVEHRSSLEGFDFFGFVGRMGAEEQTPRSKAEIMTLLRDGGERFAKWLEGLSDSFLSERVSMPPGMTPASKTRFEFLIGVKEHEMHHRGQLMLIERMVGIVPHLTREAQARLASMQAASKAGS
jgi:uncharacterized damage-inducible protein DinB